MMSSNENSFEMLILISNIFKQASSSSEIINDNIVLVSNTNKNNIRYEMKSIELV